MTEREYFTKKYFQMKNEGLTDKEIADKMFLARQTLVRYKKKYGIVTPRMNKLGFTEEELQQGENIGLTRQIMYQRFRSQGFTIKQAVSVPLGMRK